MSMCGWVLNPANSDVFSDLPMRINDIHSLLFIHQQVASAELCAGNPDPDFVHLIECEGGSFEGVNKDIVAILDDACNVRVDVRINRQSELRNERSCVSL